MEITKGRGNRQERKESQRVRQKQLREAIRLEISGMQQVEDGQLQEIINTHILEAAEK